MLHDELPDDGNDPSFTRPSREIMTPHDFPSLITGWLYLHVVHINQHGREPSIELLPVHPAQNHNLVYTLLYTLVCTLAGFFRSGWHA